MGKARLAQMQAEMRERMRRPAKPEAPPAAPPREHYALGRKLGREAHELKRERYVTAILGVRTSWPRILDNSKYVIHGGTA